MTFKMKGFPMHGTKKFEDDSIINSAPKKYEAHNGVEGFEDTNLKDGRPASSAFQQKETKETEKKEKVSDKHPLYSELSNTDKKKYNALSAEEKASINKNKTIGQLIQALGDTEECENCDEID